MRKSRCLSCYSEATRVLVSGLINFNHHNSFILQEAIFRVVAAVLHLGNINFAKGTEIDSSVIKDDKSRFHLNTAAELLK